MKRPSSLNAPSGLNWQIISSILPYLARYRLRIALALACLLLAKTATLIGPFLLKHIVDTLEGGNLAGSALWAIPLGLLLAYGLARFATVIFGEIRDTLFGRVTEGAMRRIGLRVFEHLHQLDLAFHLERRTGGLARDIERGTTGIGFLMRFFVFNIAPTLFEVVMVAFLLFWNYGWLFGVLPLFAVGLYVTYSVYTTEWRTRFVREMNQADSRSNTRAVDSLLNFETVKYFTNEELEARRYDEELALWEQARRKNRLSMFALNGGQALIIAAAQTGMMIAAAIQVSRGLMTVGDFVAVQAFMMQLFMPLNFLGFVYREIKGSLANVEKLFELLGQKPAIIDAPNAQRLTVSEGRIRYEDVQFAYTEDRPILNGLDFSVGPGEKVAVVGASGTGKSTLIKLLLRFYDVDQGRITIDGQDISQCTQHSLRQAIAIVPQDTVLFNTSLLENIRYGRPGASDAEVAEAIELAHLTHFVRSLPEGHDTLVGERGLKLSGGEKQRVAIARAVLKRSPILVFDEATSSLDSHAEQAILGALREVARGHSSLVIAHRLSTVVDADRIVVLNQGRVAETGTHSELLASGTLYARLWQAQQDKPSLPV